MKTRSLLLVSLLAGCSNNQPAPEDEDLAESSSALAATSPSDRVVIWQQNLEAMKAANVAPSALTRAMRSHRLRPDIVVMQEAWQKVLCGDYTNPDAPGDVELNNWKGSARDAKGLSRSCRGGKPALPGSVLYRLGHSLWGGAQNAGHRRPFDDEQGSTSRTGVAIAWDERRFVLEDDFTFDDGDVPGCSNVLAEYKRVAVLLRDTRRTQTTADDEPVHYGSACLSRSNAYVAAQMRQRWAGRGLGLRVIAGDFNATVDTSSARYAERRHEDRPGSWYDGLTAAPGAARFVDAARAGASDVCALWTYPNVASCASKTSCASTCPGFGIDGELERIDYVFVSDAHGTLARSRVLAAETDDGSAGYSDHKATWVVVGWP